MMTRRKLLGLLPAFALAPEALAVGAEGQSTLSSRFFKRRKKVIPVPQPFVYIGVDTAKGVGKGVYVCRFDADKGLLSAPVLAAETLRPAYFALGPTVGAGAGVGGNPARGGHRMMYVGNEGDEKTSTLTSWMVDPVSGRLTQVGRVSAGFAGPCYVAVDATGHSVYSASYAGGGVASFKIQADGTLSEAVEKVDFHKAEFGKNGPNVRQDGPHPHSTTISPDNRFVVVNDLGHDDIVTFALDNDAATLGEPHRSEVRRPGSGPRHVAFHPNGRWMYGINEIDSTIDQYLWIETHGKAAEALLTNTDHTVKTTAPEFKGVNTAAEVVVSPNGYYLYASNRGEDSLVVFAIDQGTGELTVKQRIACGGKTPRHFTFDRTGRWVVCGNQDSGSVTVFARNEGTGLLSGPVQTLAIDSPMYTLFV